MVHINLVPEKLRAAETLQLIVICGIAALSVPVAFWGWRYQAKRLELAAVQAQVQALSDELASPALKDVVAQVEQFTKDLKDLDSKRSIVDELRKRQVLILRLLDLIPDIIPRDARIRQFTIREEKGVKKVELTCFFVTLEAVASVYENLEASSLVDKLEMTDGPKSDAAGGRATISSKFKFDLVAQP